MEQYYGQNAYYAGQQYVAGSTEAGQTATDYYTQPYYSGANYYYGGHQQPPSQFAGEAVMSHPGSNAADDGGQAAKKGQERE